MKPIFWTSILFAIAALVLSACATSAATDQAPTTLQMPPWHDTQWRIVEIGEFPVTDPAPTLRFDQMTVYGSTGCNRLFGRVVPLDGGIGFALAKSGRSCEGTALRQETAFLTAISRVDGVWISDEELRLLIGETAEIVAHPVSSDAP